MKKVFFSSIFLALACLVCAQPAVGQGPDDGGGGFIDWIHKLSGPSMLGPAASYFWEWEKVHLRISGSARFPVGFKSAIGDDQSLNMLSLQPTIEIPLCGPFEIGGGIALERLGGGHPDAVYHLSIPLFGQLRLPLNEAGNWLLRVGMGAQYFPSFDASGFNDWVDLKFDEGEFSFGMILGLDYRRNRDEGD